MVQRLVDDPLTEGVAVLAPQGVESPHRVGVGS
jgi:hypothetical protein